MTSARIALGAAAVLAALGQDLRLAATLVTLGAVADGLDGQVARLLGAQTATGALFDYFADYLCFIIAPWALSRALLPGDLGPLREVLLGLPLITGAMRYARNGVRLVTPAVDVADLPGVGTIFYAFIPVVIVFLDVSATPVGRAMTTVLPIWVALFATLMVSPMRYPKLTRFSGASPAVLVLTACMPFVATTALAWTTLVLGVLYVCAAPLSQRPRRIG